MLSVYSLKTTPSVTPTKTPTPTPTVTPTSTLGVDTVQILSCEDRVTTYCVNMILIPLETDSVYNLTFNSGSEARNGCYIVVGPPVEECETESLVISSIKYDDCTGCETAGQPTPTPTPTTTPTKTPTPTPTCTGAGSFLTGTLCYASKWNVILRPSRISACNAAQGADGEGARATNQWKSCCNYQIKFVEGNPSGCLVYDENNDLAGDGWISDGCFAWQVTSGVVTSTAAQICGGSSPCCGTTPT